jgi:tetraprenyl-beta-curcumene synthase
VAARETVRMVASIGNNTALAAGFASAASRYWLGVFPRVCCEARHWRHRAEEIPDPVLRRLALMNLAEERWNLDGAAAFATFVPLDCRIAVVRAQVAFQVAYDYVDTLAEQPSADPVRNGRQLHLALLAALDPAAPPVDYYAHNPRREDAGYLDEVVHTCRTALSALPSYVAVAASALKAAARIVSYQSLNLNESQGGHNALAQWAGAQTPSRVDLRWWETAASAGSSVGLFVLIAAAANRAVPAEEVTAIEDAYFPWIGSLHSLLDSLADREEDAMAGQRSLLDYYSSPREAAARMGLLAAESLRLIRALPCARRHVLVLSAMTSHYLSSPEASLPDALPTTRCIMGTIGGLAFPTMLVMRARRAVGRMANSPSEVGPVVVHRQEMDQETGIAGNSEYALV